MTAIVLRLPPPLRPGDRVLTPRGSVGTVARIIGARATVLLPTMPWLALSFPRAELEAVR